VGNQATAIVYSTYVEAHKNQGRFVRPEIFETQTGKRLFVSVLRGEAFPRGTHVKI
jgi:hypothetical protein